jgi:hypothetical protein
VGGLARGGQGCSPIPGATGRTCRLTAADTAGTVSVIVTATGKERQHGQATVVPYPQAAGTEVRSGPGRRSSSAR